MAPGMFPGGNRVGAVCRLLTLLMAVVHCETQHGAVWGVWGKSRAWTRPAVLLSAQTSEGWGSPAGVGGWIGVSAAGPLVKAALVGLKPDWWGPGWTGVAKAGPAGLAPH